MTNFIFHQVKKEQRIDEIAYQYFKDCFNIKPIIKFNPHIPLKPYIKQGSLVAIPIEESENIDNSKLPVWKRN